MSNVRLLVKYDQSRSKSKPCIKIQVPHSSEEAIDVGN